jgi:hypothetical protein
MIKIVVKIVVNATMGRSQSDVAPNEPQSAEVKNMKMKVLRRTILNGNTSKTRNQEEDFAVLFVSMI